MKTIGGSAVGSPPAGGFQAEGREFEPRFPLIDNEEVSETCR